VKNYCSTGCSSFYIECDANEHVTLSDTCPVTHANILCGTELTNENADVCYMRYIRSKFNIAEDLS